MTDPSVSPATNLAQRSLAAERMRRHRQRKRNSMRCLTIELRETEIEMLVRQDVRQLWITNYLVVGCGAYRYFERQSKFSACAEPDKECSPMTRHRQPHIDRCFDIDEGTRDPPPRQSSSAQQCGASYLWNGTYQRLIPILPEDHPNYRENREMITQTIRRWDREASK